MKYINYNKVYNCVKNDTPMALEELTEYFKHEENYDCGWLICDEILNFHFNKNRSHLKFKMNLKECEKGYLLVDTINKKIAEFETMVTIATKIVITKRDLLNPLSGDVTKFLKYNNQNYFTKIVEGAYIDYYENNDGKTIGASATIDIINDRAYEFLQKHADFIDTNLSIRKES